MSWLHPYKHELRPSTWDTNSCCGGAREVLPLENGNQYADHSYQVWQLEVPETSFWMAKGTHLKPIGVEPKP